MLEIAAIERIGAEGIDIALPPDGFRLEPGRMTAAIGPNGSGKTTFIEALLGVRMDYRVDSEFLGTDIRNMGSAEKSNLGVCLQASRFVQGVRLKDVVGLHSRSYGQVAEDSLLTEFELTGEQDSLVSKLSGGQMKRLQLYFALAHRPRLAILDEPEGSLDQQGVDMVLQCIGERSRNNLSTLVATHNPSILAAADDIALIVRGVVVYHGTRASFFSEYLAPAILEVDAGDVEPGATETLASHGKMHCFDGPGNERLLIFGEKPPLERALTQASSALSRKCILRDARAADALAYINRKL